MDGNFVSQSRVPDVSPQETFACSLGVDPSVRITYHPVKKIKSTTRGGLMTAKTSVTSYRQRMTIKNARQISISRLVVKDHVPLSEDERIKVVVTQPPERALGPAVPSPSRTLTSGAGIAETLTAQVQKNLVARWAQKDEENGGSGGSKEDGVLEWIGTDVMDTLDIELAYEVVAPTDVQWANV